MSVAGRLRAQFLADWRAFVRRRTAVFFTFFFPVILIVIFGALVRTGAGGTGLFTEQPGWYVPGYLAVVVLFTPLTRIGSEVARHRSGNRFEKLATMPLSRLEWLLAQTLVNAAVVLLASALVLGLVAVLTGARFVLSPLLVPAVVFGVALFCGVGAVLGRIADSQDGAVAAANAVGLPLLFLSETFVPLDLLPAWFRPLVNLSPLTYFARGVRAATDAADSVGGSVSSPEALFSLGVLAVLAVVAFALGAAAIPRTD
jgi:ABC-2 type transport system permease protein